MTHHCLKATPDTVHLGGFDPRLQPALTVKSGDRVDVETFTKFYLVDRAPAAFVPDALCKIRETLTPEHKVGAGVHLLTGAIYVEEAEPGDVKNF